MYVRFSTSTGLLSSINHLLRWSFRMNRPTQDLELSKLPQIASVNYLVKIRMFTVGVLYIAAVTITVVAILAAVHLIRRIRQSEVIEEWKLEYGPHRFPYNELKLATRGFRDKEIMRFEGFGTVVYKGVIPNTRLQVAVKRISHESKQGVREFIAEIAEYWLASTLQPSSASRLGDFGLARLYEHGSNPHTTHVVGTLGYLSLKLMRTGKATTSTDVFGFGALLLEVACGTKQIDPKRCPEELVLVDWVWELHSKGKLLHAVDPRLLNEYSIEEAKLVLRLGLLCSHPHPEA